MTDAFDADIVIHAASRGSFQARSLAAISASSDRIGSVVLLPEVLIKPMRAGGVDEAARIAEILASFALKPVDQEIADASVTLGAKYRLTAADAIHLATAVVWGAERFYTNNRKDFGGHVTEIDIVVPGVD